jgi:molybdopterin-guanine dinucleotide biosynthesis protein A
VLGAVLTGGASTRMGRDKATVRVDGVAMAARVAQALRDGGARDVVFVGSELPDAFPAEGPLGGIITALRWARDDPVVIAPCDMPWIEGDHVRALVVARTDDVDVVVSQQHLFALWNPSALVRLEAAFTAGERSPKRALANLTVRTVPLPEGRWTKDVDTPEDLERS